MSASSRQAQLQNVTHQERIKSSSFGLNNGGKAICQDQKDISTTSLKSSTITQERTSILIAG